MLFSDQTIADGESIYIWYYLHFAFLLIYNIAYCLKNHPVDSGLLQDIYCIMFNLDPNQTFPDSKVLLSYSCYFFITALRC